MRIGVRIGRVGGEEHRGHDRLQLQLDAGARARLLDDGLGFLARGVDRRLVDEPQPLAVLRADAVAAATPAGGVEDPIGALDVELPAGVLRVEARGRVEEIGRRLSPATVDLLLDRPAVDEHVQRGAHGRIRQGRVSRLRARALALDLTRRVAVIELDVLGIARRPHDDAPFAALLEPAEDVVLHLHVPRVVVLAGLQHRPRGGRRVAAALHLDRVEEGAVGHVVRGIELAPHDVARLEVDEAIGAGADRAQIGGGLARSRALERLEHVLGNEHAAGPAERIGPERRRPLEHDLDGVGVELVHPFDVAVRRERPRGGRRVGGVLPVEDDVVGAEGFAVVPGDAVLETPHHGGAVARDAAVVDARQLGREDRHHAAIGIEARQRLIEDARGVLVLGARREMWVQQRRRLPPEDLQRPAAAAPARREARAWLRVSGDGPEHLCGERRRDAEPRHQGHEGASGQPAAPNVGDERAELALAHCAASMRTATSIASIMLSGLAMPFHARWRRAGTAGRPSR